MPRSATGLCVLAFCVGTGPTATAAQPPDHICRGAIQARGEAWGFQGSGVGCPFMRRRTARFLRHDHSPPHWRCTDLGDGGTCHSRRNAASFEFYAMD